MAMANRDKQLREQAYQEVEKHREEVANDPYRLKYHMMPQVGLLNDPNGWIQWNGTYHMFYQWNPFGTDHGTKFWGHKTSTDLVHWKEEPIALVSSEAFEKDGCYSGSAIDHDGKLTLLYTGNVKNEQGERESYQCIATSDDSIHFDKKGPVIDGSPEGYTAHFRDPKVWKHNDRWYLVIGAQTNDLKGEVLLYESENFNDWTLKGPIAGSNIASLGEFGYMWECPDMFHLDGKDVLIVSPQGLKPDGMAYQNTYQAGYFIGELNIDKPAFHHGDFAELDRGFEFYAPQTMEDDKGRRILVGWMGVPDQHEEQHPTRKHHWIHCLTIPRNLRQHNGRIIQEPVEELQQLRDNHISYDNIEFGTSPTTLEHVDGDAIELWFTNLNFTEGVVEWNIRGEVRCLYNSETQVFTLERPHLKTREIEQRQCIIEELEDVRMFIDASSIEIFINGGREVFTSRMFPHPENKSVLIRGTVPGSLTVDKWDLG